MYYTSSIFSEMLFVNVLFLIDNIFIIPFFSKQ